MNLPTLLRRCPFALAIATTAALVAGMPAQARIFVGFGTPPPPYYYPGPYYGYAPYYYPYYAPPDYAPPAAYVPPAGAAPPAVSVEPLPSASAPPDAATASAGYPSSPAPASAANVPASPTAPITYTDKPAFTNAAGQVCREYKAAGMSRGRPVDVYGTACRQADGQWRVTE